MGSKERKEWYIFNKRVKEAAEIEIFLKYIQTKKFLKKKPIFKKKYNLNKPS